MCCVLYREELHLSIKWQQLVVSVMYMSGMVGSLVAGQLSGEALLHIFIRVTLAYLYISDHLTIHIILAI